ncbi:MAG: hypothetical protein ACI8S6_004434, partial [Myxococcota bacterium]
MRGWLWIPLCACGDAAEPASEQQPDLIMLIASGLRADTSGPGAEAALYGALGERPSIRFTAAYAQSCVPYTSLGSLLSGRYPSAIPLCGTTDPNSLSPQARAEQPWCSKLPPQTWTLPEVLSVYGYRTGAYVSDADAHSTTDWSGLTASVGDWWRADASAPRLLVVQVLDLHMLQFDPRIGYDEQQPGLDRRELALPPEAIEDFYVARSAEVGEGFRAVLSALPASGERPREVWLTSTSGLSLRETTGVKSDHLRAVTNAVIVDRTIHVPLARLGGSHATREDDRVVELIDLLPTLAALAAAEPPAGAQGHDLLSTVPDPAPFAYAEFGDMLALREGDDLLSYRFFLHNASSLDPRLTEGLVGWTAGD